MKHNQIRQVVFPILAALIWGTAFVAQDVCADTIGTFTFNAVRYFIAVLALLVLIAVLHAVHKDRPQPTEAEKRAGRKQLWLGGFCCGTALAIASNFQQAGITAGTDAGKAGFLTALYVVLVPVFGLFLKRKVSLPVWVAVALSVVSLYLLCIKGSFRLAAGDLLVLVCAVCFAVHILVIDHFGATCDGVKLSCVQFLFAGLWSAVCIPFFEHVDAAALVPVHAAGDLQSVQGRGHLPMFRPQQTPHADGGQGVFDVEIPVHGQVIGVQGLTAPLLDEKAEAVGQLLHLPDGQIAVVPVHAHQHDLPAAPPGGVIYPVKLGRLPADHGPAAVFQQLELALQILLHGGVLLGGDVVLAEIQEHADVEVLAIDPLHLIRLAGYLGGHIRQAVIPGLGKQPLQVQGLRRGQMGVHVRASAVASGGGAEAHGPARQGVGDGLDHIGGGGFPLGAGDADKGQAVGGVVVKPPGRQALGLADVGDPDAGEAISGPLFISMCVILE